MRKKWMLGAALAVTMAGGVVMAGPGFASANNAKEVCTQVTGTATGTVTISGCSGTANTGTGSVPMSSASLLNGGTVTWLSAQTTTFAKPTLSNGNAKKCPGYVKPVKGQPAPKEPAEVKFTGAVTADTTGMKVPGKYKGDVCVDQSGNITARKPLKVN